MKESNFYAVPVLASAPVIQFGEGDFSYNGMRGLGYLGAVSTADYLTAVAAAEQRGAPASVTKVWRDVVNEPGGTDLSQWLLDVNAWQPGREIFGGGENPHALKYKLKKAAPYIAAAGAIGVLGWLALR